MTVHLQFIYSKRTGTPAAIMENQISDDVVKNRFDRLLKRSSGDFRRGVQCTRRNYTACLVESMNDHDDSLVTGRLSNNILVHFKGDESLIGKIVDVEPEGM